MGYTVLLCAVTMCCEKNHNRRDSLLLYSDKYYNGIYSVALCCDNNNNGRYGAVTIMEGAVT
eukprot:1615583-Ditylum_brightwellii.AAC.1